MRKPMVRPSSEEAAFGAAERVTRHSAVVRNLRLAVPALAMGLFMTFALSATPPRVDRAFLLQFSTFDVTDGQASLARPRYYGEDLQGQPFEVAATAATRAAADPDLIGLDKPEARRLSQAGDTVLVRAQDGIYDRAARRMDLTRDVELEQHSEGGDVFILTTDAAEVDLDSQIVTSSSEVNGEGETGTVRADRATVYQTEDRLVLEGDVKIRLEPRVSAGIKE
ncbi:MAG: LPS export ABC transporter periplasmic protein LptC [Pseudomonadota bacterium]